MIVCLLGLGSNLNTPSRQLTQAIRAIRALPKTTLYAVAPFYRNPAWGKKSVPHYDNTVVAIHTTLPPFLLLRHCQHIEKRQGRVRRVLNGARTLDIDLLTYGQVRLSHPRLRLPHPGFTARDSVQIPLQHIHLK